MGAELGTGVGTRGVEGGGTRSIRDMSRSVIALAYRSLWRREGGGREGERQKRAKRAVNGFPRCTVI